MEYTKNLLIALLAIVAMYGMWVFTMGIGPFYHLRFLSYGWHAILCLVLLAASGVWSAIVNDKLSIVAYGLTFGAALGTLFSISMWYHDILVDARGFWTCTLLWIVNEMILVVCGAALSGACIQIVVNLLKLNFLSVLLYFMLGVTAFFTGMNVLAGSFECSSFLGIMTILGVIGGGTGGVVGRRSFPDFVTDGNGSIHYVVGERADGTVLTTDGERMRERADGNHEIL